MGADKTSYTGYQPDFWTRPKLVTANGKCIIHQIYLVKNAAKITAWQTKDI
jgi:hypothetical protein